MFSQSSTQPKFKTFKHCVPVSLFKNVAKPIKRLTVKTKKLKVTKVKKHSKYLSDKIVETKNTIYIMGNNKAIRNKFLKTIGSLTIISTDQSEETDADIDVEGIADTNSVGTIDESRTSIDEHERADPNNLIELNTDEHDLTEACVQPSGNTILIQQCRLPEVQLVHIPANVQSDICIEKFYYQPDTDHQTQDFESINEEFRYFNSVEITLIFQEHAIVTALNSDDISQLLFMLDEVPEPNIGVAESKAPVERVFSCSSCRRVLIALLLPKDRASSGNCQECGCMMLDHSRHSYKDHLQCKICAEAGSIMRKHKRLNSYYRRPETTPCVIFKTKYSMTAESRRKLIDYCTTLDNKRPDVYSMTIEQGGMSVAWGKVSATGCGIRFVHVVFSCLSCPLVMILYQRFGAPRISPTCPRCHSILFDHTKHTFKEFERCVPCGVAERVLTLKPVQALQNGAKYPAILAEVKDVGNLEVNIRNEYMHYNTNQGLHVKGDWKDYSNLDKTESEGNNFVFNCPFCKSVLVPFKCSKSPKIDTSHCYVCLLRAQPHNVTRCTDSSSCGICSRLRKLGQRKHHIHSNQLAELGPFTELQAALPQGNYTPTPPTMCTRVVHSPSSATVSSGTQTVQPNASKGSKFISLDLSGFYSSISEHSTNVHTTKSGRKYTKPWEVTRRGHNSGSDDQGETEARIRKIVDSALRCRVVLPRVDGALCGNTDCSVCITQAGSLLGIWLPCEVPSSTEL